MPLYSCSRMIQLSFSFSMMSGKFSYSPTSKPVDWNMKRDFFFPDLFLFLLLCFFILFYCFLPILGVCIFLSMGLWREVPQRKVLLVSEFVLEDSVFGWTCSIMPFWLLSMLCYSTFDILLESGKGHNVPFWLLNYFILLDKEN